MQKHSNERRNDTLSRKTIIGNIGNQSSYHLHRITVSKFNKRMVNITHTNYQLRGKRISGKHRKISSLSNTLRKPISLFASRCDIIVSFYFIFTRCSLINTRHREIHGKDRRVSRGRNNYDNTVVGRSILRWKIKFQQLTTSY